MTRAMILLVSGQPVIDMVAALDPGLETELVYLVSGEIESAVADSLAAVLEARGAKAFKHLVSDSFQPEATRTLVSSIIGDEPELFTINLTGGTTPMVLGAYRAALDKGVREIVYLDHDRGLIRWLDSDWPPQKALARLWASDILQAHGYLRRPLDDPTLED